MTKMKVPDLYFGSMKVIFNHIIYFKTSIKYVIVCYTRILKKMLDSLVSDVVIEFNIFCRDFIPLSN